MKGILGRKVGMTEVFTKDGKLIPVTVVQIEPNVVTQVKTSVTDGYNAVQLGVFDKKEKNASRASIGHAKKANTNPKRFLKEIRDVDATYNLGDKIGADIFTAGEYVDVTGTSKGKGFQGNIKRHNQSRGPETHGSRYHRRPGSMGTMKPMRVMKGKKLPGQMGNVTRTVQNLEIIEVNVAEGYILISGNIPGPKKSLVFVKSAIKIDKAANPKDLITYVEETVVDEVAEITEEVTENNTEAKEESLVEETEVAGEETKEEVTVESATQEATEADNSETEENAEEVSK